MAERSGARFADHTKSMAALVRRTQPCDAGYGGTDDEPWMAMPSGWKYRGRYRRLRSPSRMPSISRVNVNRPVGVSARYWLPSYMYGFSVPVDVLNTHWTWPPRTTNTTWRDLSTSMRS